MKTVILALTFVFVTSSLASAQYSSTKENLRGLTGVRLMVMFGHCPTRDPSNCAEGLDPAQRPEVLKMVEAEAITKLQNAGIPFGLVGERKSISGDARFIVVLTLDKLNGFVHPIVTELQLMQRVRLVRDPSIEYDAVSWNIGGVGGPKLDIEMIRQLVASHLDQFIEDYLSVNPKQSAGSGNDKSRNTKH